MLQTIHKLYIEPYIEAFQTIHCERSQNYTRSGTQTLHFVFEHESREWNLEREWSGWNLEHGWSGWIESYVTFVTNVTKVTNVTNVMNVKQEMAIGGEQPFPHPTPFFGFNTSCFWRRNVLYLYRDMGEASASPFFRHFPFKNGDFRSASGKNLPSSNFNLPSSSLN